MLLAATGITPEQADAAKAKYTILHGALVKALQVGTAMRNVAELVACEERCVTTLRHWSTGGKGPPGASERLEAAKGGAQLATFRGKILCLQILKGWAGRAVREVATSYGLRRRTGWFPARLISGGVD